MPTDLATRWIASLLLALSAIVSPALAQDADAIRSGTLVFVIAEGEPVALPRVRTDVHIEVNGTIAHVELRQRFSNPSDLPAEGIYAFPLPAKAMVDRLSTTLDGRVVSEVRRTVHAQQLYDQSREHDRRFGTTAEQPSVVFRAAIAEIAPHATIDITIGYLQVVDQQTQRHSLRVPLAANTEHIPDLSVEDGLLLNSEQAAAGFTRLAHLYETAPVPAAPPHRVSLRISIDAGVGVTRVTSRHHSINVTGRDRVLVSANSDNASPAHDFELEWLPDARRGRRMPLAKTTDKGAQLMQISVQRQR